MYARRRAKYRCTVDGCTAARHDCEVNHRTPRVGEGYQPGCHHHQDPAHDGSGGLEVLCHAHHVATTNAQAAARRAAR